MIRSGISRLLAAVAVVAVLTALVPATPAAAQDRMEVPTNAFVRPLNPG
jgi:hypothetical protein